MESEKKQIIEKCSRCGSEIRYETVATYADLFGPENAPKPLCDDCYAANIVTIKRGGTKP